MPRAYNRRPGLRGIADVGVALANNPFAQMVRFSTPAVPSNTMGVPPVANLPPQWHIPRSGTSPEIRGNRQGLTPTMVRNQVSDDEDMEMAANLVQGGELQALRAPGGGGDGGTAKGSQETPISKQRPHYGLPETITAIMPTIGYFSAFVPADRNNMTFVQFRLTSMLDQMVTSVTTPLGSAPYTAGLFDKVAPTTNGTAWPATPVDFPSNSHDGSQWRPWYHKMYQYYRVLGIEYEFTIQNTQHNIANDILIATLIDTYSSGNASNVHPLGTVKVHEMEMWPDTRFQVVRSNQSGDGENTYTSVKGYYYPGRVKQNVENDEDVKTWTAVGSAPALTELLTIGFGKTPFNTTSTTAIHGCNVRFSLRKIVQYKDLHNAFRWPTSSQTDIVLTAPDDILSG